MNGAFKNGFRSELQSLAVLNGFRDEAEKLGMDKEAFIPLIPLALATAGVIGGASLAGMTGIGKPKGMPSRRWFSASRDIPKITGHFGQLGSLLMGGGLMSSAAKPLSAMTSGLRVGAGRFAGGMAQRQAAQPGMLMSGVKGGLSMAPQVAAYSAASALKGVPRPPTGYSPPTISGLGRMQPAGAF